MIIDGSRFFLVSNYIQHRSPDLVRL